MFLSLMLLLPMFVYDSFQLSNRFVGPVTRLRRVLRELAEGKPFSPVKFRKGEYWQEMADELNRAVEALSKQRPAERTGRIRRQARTVAWNAWKRPRPTAENRPAGRALLPAMRRASTL